MPRRKEHSPEQIVATLRKIDVEVAQGQSVPASWRKHHNHVRPHGSLGYRPPAPEAMLQLMTSAVDGETTAGLTH